MNLIALLIGLIVERFATQLFHLREFHWLNNIIDWSFDQANRFENWPGSMPVIILAMILVFPVFLIDFGLSNALLGVPYLFIAIIVLFLSLGPKDIGKDIDDYCIALEAENEGEIHKIAKALTEKELSTDPLERIRRVEEAVCVQANNLLFAVIFWFVLLGPFGAWFYRVIDLIRRRALFNASYDQIGHGTPDTILESVNKIHGLLTWIPVRLTAIGYAMAGSFEGALSAWRKMENTTAKTQSEHSEELLARVSIGALALQQDEGESVYERGVRGAIAANDLGFRTLFIWVVVIAVMTLYGWSV
jgi:AmpE protein